MTLKKKVKDSLKIYMRITGGQVPTGILTEIANINGCSRERVRQIAKEEGYLSFRKIYKKYGRKSKCRECRKAHEGETLYCSPKCRLKWQKKTYWTHTVCKNKDCPRPGGKFEVYKSQLSSPYIPLFCSKYCQGYYLGKNIKSKLSLYPKDREALKEKLPETFDVKTFAKTFRYASIGGAWTALGNLELKGVVKKTKDGKKAYYKII